MRSTITALDRAIAREARRAGIRDDAAAVDPIGHRQFQITLVLACVLVGLLAVVFGPGAASTRSPSVRLLTVGLAVSIVAYAVEQDRHLRRLRRLTSGSRAITLSVVDALSTSGALRPGTMLLHLRSAFERGAPAIAGGLADHAHAEVVRVRVCGPSGELPIAAMRAAQLTPADYPSIAREALRRDRALRSATDDGRIVVAVPVRFEGDAVGVVEVTFADRADCPPGGELVVDAFVHGALASLRSTV